MQSGDSSVAIRGRFRRNFSEGWKPALLSTLWPLFLAFPAIFYLDPSDGLLIGILATVTPFLLFAIFAFFRKPLPGAAHNALAIAILFVGYVFFTELPDWMRYSEYDKWLHAAEWAAYGIGFGVIWAGGEKDGGGKEKWLGGLFLIGLAAAWYFGKNYGADREFKLTVHTFHVVGLLAIVGTLLGYQAGLALSYFYRRFLQQMHDLTSKLLEYQEQCLTFISGYALLVFICGLLFASLYRAQPGCIQFDNVSKPQFADFLFFSLSTASTSGFIKAAPTTFAAQSLASLELLATIFWVTVVVSRLTDEVARRKFPPLLRNLTRVDEQ
jgi:hypothetical protein